MAKENFIKFDPEAERLICQGEWIISNLNKIKKNFEQIAWPTSGKIVIDGQEISKLDSAGAWLLLRWIKKLSKKNLKIQFENFSDQYQKLLSFSEEQNKTPKDIPVKEKLWWLQELGKYAIEQTREFYEFINFVGALFFESLRTLINPKYWRWNTIAAIINAAGTSALPIIALLSFMIGVVITYQMGNQLKNYGANIFIVNLIGYSILREFGPLLTAIMVSGRTGSAFTAHIGLMKINQEVDALNTMGITPDELLVLPRIIGVFIVVPLLTIWADIFGVIGGMLMSQSLLDITWNEFLTRFQQEIPLRSLLIGLGKAPIFALIIASIGCFEGMEVRGSAESVGTRTTRSVVLAIFFIIVVDGILSIILSKFNL